MTVLVEKKEVTKSIVATVEWRKEGGYSLLIYKDNGQNIINCSDVIKQGYYSDRRKAHNALMRYKRQIEKEYYGI